MGAVAVIYAFLPAVALSAMPVVDGETTLALPKDEGGYADDPILGVVANMDLGAFQDPAEIYVGVLAASILFIATNAGMIGVSRLTYSMGQYRQLPDRLRQLHPRYRTPYVAILLFGAIACLTIVPGQAEFLGKIYAFGAMLSFTIAHLSVVALRISQPDIERPYRIPGNIRWRGRSLPVLSIVGGLSTGIAFVVLSVLDIEVLVSGVIWLALGLTGYVLYRRNQGLSLTQTTKVVVPKPIVEHEVEYESILVAFEDGQYSGEAVAMAVRLAARRRRGIHVLVTVTVPASAPIDAAMPEAESKAQEAVDQARVRGGRRVTGHCGARPRGRRRAPDRPRGRGDPRGRDRDAGARAARRLVAVRPHRRDRPCRAPVPGDPGLVAGDGEEGQGPQRGLGSAAWTAPCTPLARPERAAVPDRRGDGGQHPGAGRRTAGARRRARRRVRDPGRRPDAARRDRGDAPP